MATELGNDRSSKLLDALILHKPKPLRRKRVYNAFNDSTCHLMDDEKGLYIGEVNQSNLDSLESVRSEVLYTICRSCELYIRIENNIYILVRELSHFSPN